MTSPNTIQSTLPQDLSEAIQEIKEWQEQHPVEKPQKSLKELQEEHRQLIKQLEDLLYSLLTDSIDRWEQEGNKTYVCYCSDKIAASIRIDDEVGPLKYYKYRFDYMDKSSDWRDVLDYKFERAIKKMIKDCKYRAKIQEQLALNTEVETIIDKATEAMGGK